VTTADADAESSTADPDPAARTAPRAVQVSCFGGFRVQIAGEHVDLGSLRPRARALLRLLALSPEHDVHRERLVDALWPGVDLSVGTRRLQVAVSSVRQLLEQNGLPGPDVLTRHGDAYRLALPEGSTVDIRSFESTLREAASCAARGDTAGSARNRAAALALYTGELLPEDGPAEYLVDDRDRFRLAAASAAAGLARDTLELGRPREALDAARRSVQLDRYQDLAWELLVQVHEASGDSSAAARARHEHARVQAELDAV
jgi:DNA-binding SARP family transcriptional activator